MGWIKDLFAWDFMSRKERENLIQVYTEQIEKEKVLAARQLAFELCVQRVAHSIGKCKFRIYKASKSETNALEYLLNVKPNPNQTATEFWDQVIHKLYYDGEVLVVPTQTGAFYIADSFTRDTSKVMSPQVFSDIAIGTLILKKKYKMNEVLYLRLNNENLSRYLDDTLSLCIQLIASASNSYRRANGTKAKIVLERPLENKDDKDENVRENLEKAIRKFLKEPDSLWLETKGMKLEQLDVPGTAKDTRDIKALLDDVMEITCKAFLMPTNIMTGEVTDTSKAVDDFLTFCLDGIAKLIQDGINALYVPMNEWGKGKHIKVDTKTIKHIDVLDMATSVDKLLSSGVLSINNILELLGYEPISEEWADEHFMTKNYSSIDELLKSLKDEKKGEEENAENENNEFSNGAESESQQ